MRISQKILDDQGKLVGVTTLPNGQSFVQLDPKAQWGLKINADGTFDALGRADSKFYEVAIEDDIGYPVAVTIEEPLKPRGSNVGTVVLVYREDGMILARSVKCVDGEPDLEAMPTSVSKGDPIKGACSKTGARTNLKRIRGPVDTCLYREAAGVVAPDNQHWVPIHEFVLRSGDFRSLAAVAAACLDPEFMAVYTNAMATPLVAPTP